MLSTLILQAALAAASVSVYPVPGMTTASETTQISFRGTTSLGAVTVAGSRSGRMNGRVREHSDGAGASWVPHGRFEEGETVRVRSQARSYSFRIGRRPTPAKTRSVRPDTRAEAESFVSRPDLKPPPVHITRAAAGRTPGFVLLGPKGGRANGPMIIDDRGELVWFRQVGGGGVAMDVRTQSLRGRPVLTWWEGRLFAGGGRGVGMVLDETYRTVKRVRMGNGFQADSHEFTITPQGTALMNAWDAVERPEGDVLQSVVQEIDIATGLVLFEWHSAGNIAVSETYRERDGTWDYLHLNSVALDPAGDFILSARSTNAVYKVSRATGRVLWRLGGRRSSFTFGPGARFALQHDARPQPDGTLTLFDNAERGRSRAIRLRLDGTRATLVRALTHPRNLLSRTQAGMQPLPNGNTFVGWGSNRWFSEYDANGKLIFDGRMARRNDSYRAYRGAWVGRPSTRPSLARRGADVFVSWNGATEVTAWQVEGAPPVPRTGFETALRGVPAGATIRALDVAGTVLGQARAQ
ncbi:arylsulfotransferase family protein [Solirubrobacter sp. CPCC 204708]|uniref:Arylsulfotransferase family protein n=1 Tax=Solirubrobacter deserti TaxID=2282478 RepID=A0ABT4RQJ5_9ACTN|nr:arylsulfotransferase family protein [Solirubrobacter deserti]MBE2320644.1 arylsulfotransferase family protein [Solirubrobacter deserti]MDA0140698.1 arylsulfotransferase family protein [Solirubrobacter deserti]